MDKTLTFLVNDCGISNINADIDPKEIISLYYDCQKRVLKNKQKLEENTNLINSYINLLSLGKQYNENEK